MSRTMFVKSALRGDILDVGHSVGPLHDVISREKNVIAAIDIVIKAPGKKAVKGDATRMPFKAGTFDSLLAGELIEHIESPNSFLKEGHRVLKTGGLMVLSTPNRKSLLNRLFKLYDKPAHLSLFSKKELFLTLKQSGFTVQDCKLFPYTEESSEGSRHKWFYPVRKIMHYFLPNQLQEQFVVVARSV